MENTDDDLLLRSEKFREPFGGVSTTVFSHNLDDAINHAANATADAVVRPWVPMGPRNIGGRIAALAQDPKNPDVLYAGSGFGGVWKSTDWGDTWAPLDDFRVVAATAVHRGLPVGAIAISRSNPQVVYVGTGEPTLGTDGFDYEVPGFGLYRSSDGGTTFLRIADVDLPPIQATRFERILVDPWQPDRCWIACLKGLFRREPGGAITPDVVGAGAPANQNVSDIAIDFGPLTAAVSPPKFTIYVALRGDGIYRGEFTVATTSYGNWKKLDKGIDEKNFNRIKLAHSVSQPTVLYSAFTLKDRSISRVYRTDNRGDEWKQTSKRPDDAGKQGEYDLVLEVHPTRPEIVFTGSVELWRTQDSGEHWEKVLNWTNYDAGDHAQHADQHAFLFDAGRDGTVWLGNDGGISRSRNFGVTWRKKSYGILAVMFSDLTIHQTYPWVTAGGFQDNGCWVGFGGPTWVHLYGGDGGACVFNPNSLSRVIATWQGTGNRGVEQCDFSNIEETPGLHYETKYKTPLPDYRTIRPGDNATTRKLKSDQTSLTDFSGSNKATFTGVMEHHPSVADHFLVGRKGAAYVTVNGKDFTKQKTTEFKGNFDPEVSAVAYAPSAANTDWWITTTRGEVFRTIDSGANWVDVTPPDIAAGFVGLPKNNASPNYATDVAIHPSDPNIAVVTSAQFPGGQVHITGDKGTTWLEISGRTAPAFGILSPGNELNPSATMCVAFDPTVPAAGPHTLYVGTLAGVYVVRNAVGPKPGVVPPAPVWRTFNNNLPLTLVYDIQAGVAHDPANTPRNFLRCGTFGRGLWECDLAGAKPLELFIRSTPISDGRRYIAAETVVNDPRLVPAEALRFDRAFDVRIAVPPFGELEDTIDGVEFDEMLVNVIPLAGQKNQVYVQVHTNGSQTVNDVRVALYYAEMPGAAVPDLQAGFWEAFPNDPPAGTWAKVAVEFAKGLSPAQPVVQRLEWIPPLDAQNGALLAVCSHATDDIKVPGLPTRTMDVTNANCLVRTERRAALRVTTVDPSFPSVYVRDGINDVGPAGSVAWGGSSPDIIVRPAVEATPDITFADLGDARFDDVILGDTDSQIYVRVSNRSDLTLTANVDLYTVPHDSLDKPNTWAKVGATVKVENISAKSAKLTTPIKLDKPPDPAAGIDYKVFFLVAVVYRGVVAPVRDFTDLTTLWKFLMQGKDANTDMSAACRGLRWKAKP